MKIEHWRCQSRNPERQLQYSNLMAACHGRGPAATARIATPAKARPGYRKKSCSSTDHVDKVIRCTGGGRNSSDDAAFDAEINLVLNLNARHLVNERRDVLDLFKVGLGVNTGFQGNASRSCYESGTAPTQTENFGPTVKSVVYWLQEASGQR